ncbi:hypothetical protein FRB99_004166 [Tulasnella sp. 403]|nr:hypothetical protein FRB99_004166 [Tulasnella sp. 403]
MFTTVCLAVFTLYLLFRFSSPDAADDGRKPKIGKPGRGAVYKRTIVAVGDLHGDYPNMMEVLKMAKVVTENGSWSGEVDYFVQTGDIIDRRVFFRDDTIQMYRYLENLRVDARAVGGDIRSHLGNHEVMNMIGDWRYVPESEIRTFGGIEERQTLLSKGWIGRAWRANYSITTRLPLHPALGPVNTDYQPAKTPYFQDLSHAALSFLHGGLSPSYRDLTPYPSGINNIGATLIARLQDRRVQPPPHPPNDFPHLPEGTTPAEHALYDGNGPLWYRGWAMNRDAVVCKTVDEVLQKVGVKRLVMGHTPHFTGIVSRCGGKILLIDTGQITTQADKYDKFLHTLAHYLFPQMLARFSLLSSLILVWLAGPRSFQAHDIQRPFDLPLPDKPQSFRTTVVAVGDLHADFPSMMSVLYMSGVISDNGSWTGDVDYLVQTGNVIGFGYDTKRVFETLERLRVEARAAGGDVLTHLGEDEFANVMGDWKDVPDAEIWTFGGHQARHEALTSGWIGRAWRDHYSIATRLPLHPIAGGVNTDFNATTQPSDLSNAALAFTNSGLSPSTENLIPFPSALNMLGVALLDHYQDLDQVVPTLPDGSRLPDIRTLGRIILGDNGPLGYRGLALENEKDICQTAGEMLRKIGAKRIVVGSHYRGRGIVSRCGGKILLTHTGISHMDGGILSAVKFTYTLMPGFTPEGWTERDVVTAIYSTHEAVIVDETRKVNL